MEPDLKRGQGDGCPKTENSDKVDCENNASKSVVRGQYLDETVQYESLCRAYVTFISSVAAGSKRGFRLYEFSGGNGNADPLPPLTRVMRHVGSS